MAVKVTVASARFARIQRPELFFGVVGAIGTDLSLASAVLAKLLERVGYTPHHVVFSGLAQKHVVAYRSVVTPEKEELRYRMLMKLGTEVCRGLNRREALARLAITEIRAIRRRSGTTGKPAPLLGHAYILKSLKRPREIEFLRQVYGDAFNVIAVHSRRGKRRDTLAEKIARTHFVSDSKQFYAEAENLMDIDERERDDVFGQDVRGAFPLADFFVGTDDSTQLEKAFWRFIRLVFGDQFETPTGAEIAMSHAQTAALRSADLSRQVGAAIVRDDGRIVATGCNEVPAAGGGQYRQGNGDKRDFQLGFDSNTRLRRDLVLELLGRMREAGEWLDPQKAKLSPDKLVEQALSRNGIFAGSRATSLIEFGRMVHAEMAAIVDSARSNSSPSGCDLYTTTFPCHLCMRHIIAAGISSVFYIEPYAKSLAAELYHDSIIIDPEITSDQYVNVQPFEGVSPRRYFTLFSQSNDRKMGDGTGKVKPWVAKSAKPSLERFTAAGYVDAENASIRELAAEMKSVRFAKILATKGMKHERRAASRPS
jgi:cytidine deaminase